MDSFLNFTTNHTSNIYTDVVCFNEYQCFDQLNTYCGSSGNCTCTACFEMSPLGVCSVYLWPIIGAFLLSFFLGGCGIDHCILSGCTCPGIVLGFMKGLTLGGCGFWWLADIIIIGIGAYPVCYAVENPKICSVWVV